jgi:hypothetical protein
MLVKCDDDVDHDELPPMLIRSLTWMC